MRDELKNLKSRQKECAIMNLQTSLQPGSHWVAWVRRHSTVLYYDSIGDLPPCTELKKYLEGCSIYYNYETEQTLNSVICGHLCLLFLVSASKQLQPAKK